MKRFLPVGSSWLWLALWLALLLPLVLTLPPIPIDETRYLTVAWEMFRSGQWLVPTVNGAWYSDKSPLLFWLIAGGWKLVGVHTWVARIEALIIALGMLLAVRRLAARLGMDRRGAATALWLLAGCLGLLAFSAAIMFDLLLSLCVLGALHGLMDLDEGKWVRGTIAWGVAIGLGILAKGPVMLLNVVPVAVLAPWWSATARGHKARWYPALAAGFLIGVAIAFAWVIPAALYAGPSYWHPLLDKVTGRIADSFAHNRPWWWYLPLVPLLLLPWLVTLRAPGKAWTSLWRGRFGRFVWCWWAIPFIAFCAISGKQVHYLLPLLPAWALAGAWLLQQTGARLKPVLFGVFVLLVGAAIVVVPWQAARTYRVPVHPAIAALAVVAVIVALGAWLGWARDARRLALSMTALVSAALLAGALAYQPALSVRREAQFVKRAVHAHVAIVHVQPPNGLLGYAGRLHHPVAWIAPSNILAWCRTHPEGIILTSKQHVEPTRSRPFRTWPYVLSGDHRIAAWRASAILAAHRGAE